MRPYIRGFMDCLLGVLLLYFISKSFAVSPELKTEFSTPEQIKSTLGEWALTIQPREHDVVNSTPTATQIQQGYIVQVSSNNYTALFLKFNGKRFQVPGILID